MDTQVFNIGSMDYSRAVPFAILGIGGTGKTALSIKLAEQIQAQFEWVIWRSLHNALLWIFLLDSLVDVSASHQKLDLSQDIQQIAKLLDFFKQYRCLLVLDNAETILANPNEDPKVNRVGHYRPGFEPYGELFKRTQTQQLPNSDQSSRGYCHARRKNSAGAIAPAWRLPSTDGRDVQAKGNFSGSEQDWQINSILRRQPFGFEDVSTTIHDLFASPNFISRTIIFW